APGLARVKVRRKFAGAHALTVTGDPEFDGEVGHTSTLTSLEVTGNPTIKTAYPTRRSSDLYDGTVMLASDTNLTAGSTGVKFGSKVDGANALTGTGDAEFDGEVCQTASLTSLEVTGNTTIKTDKITTVDAQSYDGPVMLASD